MPGPSCRTWPTGSAGRASDHQPAFHDDRGNRTAEKGNQMSVSFVLEALVVLGAIVMGTRAGGVGVGLWGGLGTFVLVFVFGEAPGEPPAAALAIILAVVTTPAIMQAAGGIDWMVAVAARVISKHPKQITLIVP